MIVEEELWTKVPLPVCYLVTTNAVVEKGRLVMGTGAALQAKNRIPGIDREAAEIIEQYKQFHEITGLPFYGVLTIRPWWGAFGEDGKEKPPTKAGFGIFQVKFHWRDKADPRLISMSWQILRNKALTTPKVQYRMNYPGIGAGGLERKDLEHLFKWIPDNVTICYRDP